MDSRNRWCQSFDVFNSMYVDFIHTYSNDIIEVYECLGIEAARELLIEQITEVIEFEGSILMIVI